MPDPLLKGSVYMLGNVFNNQLGGLLSQPQAIRLSLPFSAKVETLKSPWVESLSHLSSRYCSIQVANMSYRSELKAELKVRSSGWLKSKRKEEERKKKETDQQKEAVAPVQEESDLEKKRREAEALLQSMGLTAESPTVPSPMSPPSKSVSTPSEAGSQDSGDGTVGSRRGPVKLGMAKITQVDFPPHETVTYTKETQAPVMAQPKEEEEEKMMW